MNAIIDSIKMDLARIDALSDNLKNFLSSQQTQSYAPQEAIFHLLLKLLVERKALTKVLDSEVAAFVSAEKLKVSAGSDFTEGSSVVTTDELPAVPKKAHAKS